jgi:tRNA G46 methylase TrmB
MGPVFLMNCLRILKEGGTISFITDALPYEEQVREAGNGIKGLEMSCIESPEAYPTFFAQKWQKEGRRFYGIRWVKIRSSGP